MKLSLFFSYALIVISNAAFASVTPFTCTTDFKYHAKAKVKTDVTVYTQPNQVVMATSMTTGLKETLPTEPQTFNVNVSGSGQISIYSNEDMGFELTVYFQPLGGIIYGTLVEDFDGDKVETPMTCKELTE